MWLAPADSASKINM